MKTNDMRLSRTFRHGRMRVQPFMEIFNLLNLSTVLTVNETSGRTTWIPAAIVSGPAVPVGGHIDW